MNIALHGIGLGGGIAIGQAFILDKDLEDVAQFTLEDSEVTAEVLRFENALRTTRKELEYLRGNIPYDAPAELGAFLSLNIMMLSDSQIAQAPVELIKRESCNAEWAIKLQADYLSHQFDEMEDEYLKERKTDVVQVLERIFRGRGSGFEVHPDVCQHCGALHSYGVEHLLGCPNHPDTPRRAAVGGPFANPINADPAIRASMDEALEALDLVPPAKRRPVHGGFPG